MIFENPQIDTEALPSLNDVEFSNLAPAYRKVEYIGTAIFFTFLLAVCVIAYFSIPDQFAWLKYLIFGVWTAAFAISMYLAGLQYERAGYALREKDVIHRHGVWWHTITTISFSRMQHCEISQGPVQNAFGLATLRIFTAGGTSSDIAIEGLAHEEAVRIKDFITRKISGSPSPVEEALPEDSLTGEVIPPPDPLSSSTPTDT